MGTSPVSTCGGHVAGGQFGAGRGERPRRRRLGVADQRPDPPAGGEQVPRGGAALLAGGAGDEHDLLHVASPGDC
jgi:hypothetical protein